MNKKILFLIGFYLISLSIIVSAHDHPVYFPEDKYLDEDVLEGDPLWVKAMYFIWGLHDHIHWIVILLMLFTCYHFRFFSGKKLFGHPRECFKVDKSYSGEGKLHQYHRLFWWGNLIFIAIHWSEVITGLRFGLDYTYTFSSQGFGIFIELLYVITFTLWLLSCHFFRYFLGGKSSLYSKCGLCALRGNIYHANGKFNKLHGVFMWLAIISMVLLIIVSGHL